jgi:hypothetical protein
MTQLKSFDAFGVQFGWDQTSIKLAEECLKKYQYVMLEGWRSRGGNTHFIFGGVYAKALENFHKLRAEGMDHEEALVEVVHQALLLTWIYPPTDPPGLHPTPDTGEPWVSDHNTKTRENLIRTIVWYFEHFKEDPCQTVVLSNGKAAVEHSFQLPVDNDIVFAGHLDRVVEYAHNPYIQDQKTTGGTISSYYFVQYELDTQMSMYSFAGRSVFGLPIKGVMIDAAQIAVGFTRFERGFTFRTESQLTEWYDDTMHLIEDIRHHTKENHFPKKLTSCGNYGGCEFRGVCARSPDVRKNFLEADFKQGWVWDPLERR